MKNKKGFWNKDFAVKVLEDALKWMKKDDENVFFYKYIIENHKITDRQIEYMLNEKYRNDEEVSGLWAQLRDLQRERIIEKAITGKFKENFAKFFLNVKYGMVPKTQEEVVLKSSKIRFEFGIDDFGNDEKNDEKNDE